MPRFLRSLARASLVAAAALALASCSESPTAPGSPASTTVSIPVYRTVTVVLRDSLGAPLAGAETRWMSDFVFAPPRGVGLHTYRVGTTDAAGQVGFSLWEGAWYVVATHGAHVAGASFTIPGPERPASDTLVVNLVAHTPSRITGAVVLAGRKEQSGTLVGGEMPESVPTAADGSWSAGGLPPGRWPFLIWHPGFEFRVVYVHVVTPGSAVVAPVARLVEYRPQGLGRGGARN